MGSVRMVVARAARVPPGGLWQAVPPRPARYRPDARASPEPPCADPCPRWFGIREPITSGEPVLQALTVSLHGHRGLLSRLSSCYIAQRLMCSYGRD